MNENTNAKETGLSIPETGPVSIVEDLARQAKHYARGTAFNMLQLGRVLTEAKELVPHGEWAAWVDENAELDLRAAQYFMSCYAKYGVDPEKAKLGQSKLIAMLPMSEEELEKLLATKDVQKMSVRELREEVRKAREEEQRKARETVEAVRQDGIIQLARQKETADKALALVLEQMEKDKEAAEKALSEAMEQARQEKEREIAQVVEGKDREILARTAHQSEQIEAQKAQLEAMRAEADSLRARVAEAEESAKAATEAAIEGARDVSRQSAETEAEARKLRRELEEKDALIEEMQEQYNQIQQEYLNAQSALAKGDAERSNAEILSAEAVGDAVRAFIGQVGRVPYMHGSFATMELTELEGYRENVLQVKEWAEKSLNAIEAVNGIGGVI